MRRREAWSRHASARPWKWASSTAIAARPGVPQYLFNLGATERMIGLLDAAEAHCDAAIALDPHYSLAHYRRHAEQLEPLHTQLASEIPEAELA